ncbi:NAC domain-containing 83-like [Olea europaea subsp. europaea]|uniref:NAC domain-containing 83-like n=1 Tax=Olea europaea subsp. europaea TaxID=158383 RepID=A0A8S0VE47_OLEEU|nr:NAC domain-containing 83-like [Olea europaea subsp. europaea]
MAFSIPPSFVFKPTDQKLITLYLKPKAMGFPLPYNRILERNLYGKNGTPWIVFSDNDPWEIVGESEVGVLKKEIYVFTKLEKIGRRHIVRVAGCGTWGGKSVPKDIKNCKGEVIGVKKSFTFKLNGDLKQEETNMKKGRWIMHEYTLAGSSLEGVNNTDYAICRISWDQEETDLVVQSGFGTVEDIHESQKRNSSFERPAEKRARIDKDLDDKELNFGASMSCHGPSSDKLDEDFSNCLLRMISFDDIESTDMIWT